MTAATRALVAIAALSLAGVAGTPARGADAPATPEARFDHAAWTKLLERHVDDDGRVAYRDLAANDAPALDAYLAALAAADPSGWPRDEQLAFWINAYNAVIVRAVLDGQSAESLLGRYRMFFRYARVVGGKERTPDEIENRVLRPSGESRIHFALVCASSSCPKLMRRAWQAATLDADLDAEARRFVQDPTRNQIRPGAPEIRLSEIFDWYEDDFGGSDAAVRAYVARYAGDAQRAYLTNDAPEIDHLDYDWSMNAQPGQQPQ